MGLRPQFVTVLEMEIRTYDYPLYSEVYTAKGDNKIGRISKADGQGLWQTEAGFVGSRQECLEQVVRTYRISSPNQKQPAPPPVLDRKEFLILDERVWVCAMQLTPALVVQTHECGSPLGVLLPAGEGWRRPSEVEGQPLEACLETMVREFRHQQRGVTRV